MPPPPLPERTAHTLGSLEAVETSLEQTLSVAVSVGVKHPCVWFQPGQVSFWLIKVGREFSSSERSVFSLFLPVHPPPQGKLNMIYFLRTGEPFVCFGVFETESL